MGGKDPVDPDRRDDAQELRLKPRAVYSGPRIPGAVLPVHIYTNCVFFNSLLDE